MSSSINLPVFGGSGAGVTSLNGLSGALTLVAGTNITIVPSGGSLTINSTGGLSPGSNILYPNSTIAFDASVNEQAAMRSLNANTNFRFDGRGSLIFEDNDDASSVYHQLIIKSLIDAGVGFPYAGRRNLIIGNTDKTLTLDTGSDVHADANQNIVLGTSFTGGRVFSSALNGIVNGYAILSGQIFNIGNAGYTGGFAANSAQILNTATGTMVHGSADNGSQIVTSGDGSHAHGRVGYSTGSNSSYIDADGMGSHAAGFIRNDVSTIIASGSGSYAAGATLAGGSYINAGDSGSFVHGVADGASLSAAAAGSSLLGYSESNSTMDQGGLGAFMNGYAQSQGYVANYGNGSFTFGNVGANGGTGATIQNYSHGSLVGGYAPDANGAIVGSGYGVIVLGAAIDGNSTIQASGNGSSVIGNANGGSNLTAQGAGSLVRGYAADSSLIESTGDGSYSGGHAVKTSNITIDQGSNGSFVFGHTENGHGKLKIGDYTIQVYSSGSWVGGFADDGTISSVADGISSSTSNGSFTTGVALSGALITTQFDASQAWGYATDDGSKIWTTNGAIAALANGYVSGGGQIKAQNIASHGEGYVTGTGTISGSGIASWARGWVEGAGSVSAGDIGFAFGHVVDGYISSSRVGLAFGWVDTAGQISSIYGGLAYGFAEDTGIIQNFQYGNTAKGHVKNNGTILSYGTYDLGSGSPLAGGNLVFGDADSSQIQTFFSRGSLVFGVSKGSGLIQAGYDDFTTYQYEGSGSIVGGYASDSSSITALNTGVSIFGAFAHGNASGSSSIAAYQNGTHASGTAFSGSSISVLSDGGFAHGFSGNNSTIKSNGAGAFVGGAAQSSPESSALGLYSTGSGSLAFGYANAGLISAGSEGSVAIGYSEGQLQSVGIGSLAGGKCGITHQIYVPGEGSIAWGTTSYSDIFVLGMGSASFGSGNNLTQDYSYAMGFSHNILGYNGIALGGNILLRENFSIGIGTDLASSYANTILIGEELTSARANSIMLGMATTKYVEIYSDAINHNNLHITSTQTTAPTTTVYTGVIGTGGSASVVGTDTAGIITLTAGTVGFGTGAAVDINYNTAYANGSYVVISAENANAGADMSAKAIYSNGTTSKFTIYFGSIITVPGRVYQFTYHVIGK